MIVDDLLARSAALRALSQDTHVIRAPFPVYPFDQGLGRLRWLRDRAPRGLIRLDGVRAPFPAVILAKHPGCEHISARSRAVQGCQVRRFASMTESGSAGSARL